MHFRCVTGRAAPKDRSSSDLLSHLGKLLFAHQYHSSYPSSDSLTCDRMSKRENPAKNFSANPTPRGNSSHPEFFPLYNQRRILIAFLAVIFYANTYQNQFALDDGLVYRDNT